MPSQKPYLIRAIVEWCKDGDLTPYLATIVDHNTQVPIQYVQNETIVLNISEDAARNLCIDNTWITFGASFDGNFQQINIPTANVTAIFAKETGMGMQFEIEAFDIKATDNPNKIKKSLKLVK